MSRRMLVLDFDGTVCLGDDPVLAYADEVIVALGAIGRTDAAAALRPALEVFLRGQESPLRARADDGYQAITALAGDAGLPGESLGAAYRASRARLLTGEIAIAAPPGLAETLAGLEGVHRVLVTNAPRAGIEILLERLGLTAGIDEIVGDAGKPAGMAAVIRRLLDAAEVEPTGLLAVGDIWANDLAAAHELGATTVLIDPLRLGRGDPSLRVAAIGEAYPALTEWAAVNSV